MLAFPIATLIRFLPQPRSCRWENRPKWFVRGGSRHYVEALLPAICAPGLGAVAGSLPWHEGGVTVTTAPGPERFDHVVLAGHSDQSLALLQGASSTEQAGVLGAIAYQPNRAVLHLDERLLPLAPRCLGGPGTSVPREDRRPGRRLPALPDQPLQPLPWQQPVIVSSTRARGPTRRWCIARSLYAHPVFDEGAIRPRPCCPALQGEGRRVVCRGLDGLWLPRP